MDKIYDLIIIGAGPAGITASVYAARKRMDFIVLTGDIGGQTIWSGDIENYTGYQFISGTDLASKFQEHIQRYGIEVVEGGIVENIERTGEDITVTTAENTYAAHTVIIASGKRSRELNVPGEQEFKNKGVTYCATCDGPLFAGKDVAVVGGGNSALEAAIQLVKISKKIYMVNNTSELGGDPILREKVIAADNITVFNDSEVVEIFGDKFVNGIKIKKEGELEEIPVQGIFVEIGLRPNSSFVGEVEKNSKEEVIVNCQTETNVSGVFAAGDVTNVVEKQIIIAAGEGSKAALRAFKYLTRRK